jgi:hypothetical protein
MANKVVEFKLGYLISKEKDEGLISGSTGSPTNPAPGELYVIPLNVRR